MFEIFFAILGGIGAAVFLGIGFIIGLLIGYAIPRSPH